MIIKTEHLGFQIGDNADNACFLIDGKQCSGAADSDFWRLILDDGERTEIPVCSHRQTGSVKKEGLSLRICYSELLSDYGDRYDISLVITVSVKDGLLEFSPAIANRTENTRVNECFCPLADFESVCGEKAGDKMYIPTGLGRRITDPWNYLESLTSNYYSHNDTESFLHQHYPRGSMGWFGVESGGYFLYAARYDRDMRHCFLTVRHRIHSSPSNIMLGVDHFPMLRPGETLTVPSSVIGLLEGDWRSGADKYRKWADENFYKVPEKADWVKNMSGWQRIIMRSQYGEDYYKAEDLPDVYLAGVARGIKTIFLFAWWKEGMDRNYPTYNEPYPGAYDALRESIAKIQSLGGRVILECNCHFLDPANPFYKEHGDEVKILDINGNEVRPAFVYAGMGEFRVTYGQKQFPICCCGTELWRNQVLGQLKLLNSFGADCLFTDCYGGTPYQPCFNDKHQHGARVDEEWIWHKKFFEKAAGYCESVGKVLATEVVTDIAASYNQFIHGNANVNCAVKTDAFPEMFRYTFPELISTCRGIRDEEGDFAKRLKISLLYGLRIDAELYVCRKDFRHSPAYAAAVGFCASKFDEYGSFFYDGRFTVIDTSELPYYIKRSEYYDKAGTRVLRILYNASKNEYDAGDTQLLPDEMKFEIFDLENYQDKVKQGGSR